LGIEIDRARGIVDLDFEIDMAFVHDPIFSREWLWKQSTG
jgi:hypothetical protein